MTPRHCAWQAWHKLTSTVVLRGRRGTYGTGWRAWTWLGARDAAAFCVAGVAQPHIYRHFTWQAWHNLTSTVIYRHFTWPAWHNLTSTVVLRGRRGTYGTGWRAWTWLGAPWRRGILRGRRGTTSHLPSFHVAGVAQPHIYRRFAWQAWHLWHWVARLDLVRILITAKRWHSCNRLNCIVSAHVALIASCIYAVCPFAARYFSALLQSMPTTAGCAADLYQKNYFISWFRLDPFSVLPGVACQWWSNAQAGSCTCGVVWHSGGDIHSRPSIRLINKISTVVKLCRIDWFLGFILCRDIAAVM